MIIETVWWDEYAKMNSKCLISNHLAYTMNFAGWNYFTKKKEPNVPSVQFLSKFEFGSNMGNTNVVDDRTKICSVT